MPKKGNKKIIIVTDIESRFIKCNQGGYISKELADSYRNISMQADVSMSELMELAGRKLLGLPIDHLALKNLKIIS